MEFLRTTGATWQLNVVGGNHVVAKTAYLWTGSQPRADKVYLYALNHTGTFQPTRLVKEASFYYSIGLYTQRDFAQINPPTVYQAPVTSFGYVLMRTGDFANPNGWAAWTGGTTTNRSPARPLRPILVRSSRSKTVRV